jgi:hypothetical protein
LENNGSKLRGLEKLKASINPLTTIKLGLKETESIVSPGKQIGDRSKNSLWRLLV